MKKLLPVCECVSECVRPCVCTSVCVCECVCICECVYVCECECVFVCVFSFDECECLGTYTIRLCAHICCHN